MSGAPAAGPLQIAAPHDVDGVLGTLSRHAVALRSQSTPPTSVRVSACGVTLELSWTDPAPSLLGSVAPRAEPAATGSGSGSGSGSGEHHAASDAAARRHQVCSPTVGVFYRAPEPGAEPFVSEGDLVVAGQQVGVVEAMKLMIPVEAVQSGRVCEVLVANGAPVEHGQPLLLLGSPDPGAGLPDGTSVHGR